MPGKPHNTSFPEQAFSAKDQFGLDSKREVLIRPPLRTVTLPLIRFAVRR